jgi:hypothetical protein
VLDNKRIIGKRRAEEEYKGTLTPHPGPTPPKKINNTRLEYCFPPMKNW